MDPKLADLLAVARFKASRAVPFLSRALWACSYVEDSSVRTFAIDRRWRVYVNPDFAKQCEADGTLPGVLVHETLHPTMLHYRRGEVQGADPKAVNVAGDLEINARIDEVRKKDGTPALALPSGALRAARLKLPPGLTLEEYLPLLRGNEEPEEGGCSGGSGAGNPRPGELPEPGELPPESKTDETDEAGEGAGGGDAGEEGDDGPPGLSEAEGAMVRASVAAAIKEANGKRPGSVSAGMLRWAESIGEAPALPWAELAMARIRYATATRRGPSPTYARPSRRTGGGMVLPVYRVPLPKVAIVCDTSGSMGEGDIAVALAAVSDACFALGSVVAVPCDAVADAVEVRGLDDLRESFRGGGGTDMAAGIARATDESPDAIVVVTDGETGWPSEAPEVPVIVVLTRKPSHCAAPPSWADVVHVRTA